MNSHQLIENSLEIPSVPLVASKIQQLINDENASVSKIESILMADQALAAKILKLANSAFYGMTRKITSVQDAILVMGLMNIKNLALAVSTKDVYKNFGLLEKKMWEHSMGVSIAAGLISKEVKYSRPEDASICGLLHDIGKAVINNKYPEKFLLIAEMNYEGGRSYCELEQDMFGFTHTEVGGLLAQKWEFPESLTNTIRLHHAFDSDDPDLGDSDEHQIALCKIINLADSMCIQLGVGYKTSKTGDDSSSERLRKMLEISEDKFSEIIESFKESYVSEKTAYQF